MAARALKDLMADGEAVAAHRPWPRAVVSSEIWSEAAQQLQGGHLTLLGLWGEPGIVHMAVLDEGMWQGAVLSLRCVDGRFPSVVCIRRRSGSSARLRISSASPPTARPIREPGSITGNGAWRSRLPRTCRRHCARAPT